MANLARTMAEYQEMFGIKEDGRRKNAILFKCFTDRNWRSFLRQNDCATEAMEFVAKNWPNVTDMATLKSFGFMTLSFTQDAPNIWVMNYRFQSPLYATDEMRGICEDGTPNAIRYVNLESNRAYRMKSGKMLMHIINAHPIGAFFPPQMKTYLCEEFSRDWIAHSMSKIGGLELSTEISFDDIYGNGSYDCNDFGSCMNGRDQSDFYDKYVDATPAALVNKDEGEILARCVVFNEVTDEDTGKVYRLAERQYSKHGDETLKKALVELLISKGLIDGYKSVGAGCGDASAFVLNDGTPLGDKTLSIACSISWGDILSYQDSFKWLKMGEQKAYNKPRRCDAYLDSTEGRLGGDDLNYDEYHDCDTRNDVIQVYYDGSWISCDESRLEDFVYINGVYVHEDDVMTCDVCGNDFVPNFVKYYSDLLGKSFCCADCREEAEEEYLRQNWHYSQYDNKYFKSENDITQMLEYDWQKEMFLPMTIGREKLVQLYLDGRAAKRGDVFVHVCGISYEFLENFLAKNKPE